MLSREATNTNFIVFGLTRPGLEPTIYRTLSEQGPKKTHGCWTWVGRYGNYFSFKNVLNFGIEITIYGIWKYQEIWREKNMFLKKNIIFLFFSIIHLVGHVGINKQFCIYALMKKKTYIYATFLSQFQVTTRRGDCSYCWYRWNCWPSVFEHSFHNSVTCYVLHLGPLGMFLWNHWTIYLKMKLGWIVPWMVLYKIHVIGTNASAWWQ